MDKQRNTQPIYIISVDYGGAWAWLKEGGEINDKGLAQIRELI